MSTHMSTDLEGSEQISSDQPEMGRVEAGLRQQIARQEADGEMDARWAGKVALAIELARTVDRMDPGEKAYAKAQLMTAAVTAFDKLLPPPKEREVAGFDAVIQGIQAAAAGLNGED